MPIRNTLIEQEAQKNVIVLDDAQTVRMAVQLFDERAYEAENNVFLVVAVDDGSYRATNFLKLGAILEEVGWEQIDASLREIPIPEAEVVDRAAESSGSFIERVNNSPGKPFVVVDGINFVALFFNPNLSDTGAAPGTVSQARSIHPVAMDDQITIKHVWRNPATKRDETHEYTYNKGTAGLYVCQKKRCSKTIDATGKEVAG